MPYLKLFDLKFNHERGNAWNLDSSKKKLVIKNANLSKLILCNSEAAKIILNKKFDIKLDKIKVIYNGVSTG